MFPRMASVPRDRLSKIPTLTFGFSFVFFFFLLSTWESHLLGNRILPVPPAEPIASILFRAASAKRLLKETEADSRKLPSGFRVADAHMSLEKIQQGRRWKIPWAGWWRLKYRQDFPPSEFLQLNLVVIIGARKRRLVDVFITSKFFSKQPYFYVYLPETRVVWPPSSPLRDGQEESVYLSPHCSFGLCFLAKLQPDKRGRRLSPPYMHVHVIMICLCYTSYVHSYILSINVGLSPNSL